MVKVRSARWHQAVGEIIARTHLCTADELPGVVGAAGAKLGIDVELYLADYRQEQLFGLRPSAGPPQNIDSSLAGRAYRYTEVCDAVDTDGRPVLWLPLLDGAERLGVLRMSLPADADPASVRLREHCMTFAGLVGHLTITKFAYCDAFHVARRARPLSLAAELLSQLLPPRTFATERLVITAVVEPFDDVGGDGYDYAVDDRRARVAVFDAVGHHLDAGLTCALALAATRNARRSGADLLDMAARADDVIRSSGAGHRFVTALLADLDLDTGVLDYVNAGHPPAQVLRAGRAVRTLGGGFRVPLGLGHLQGQPLRPGREQLEPGDRLLLYTDGVIEARAGDGSEFGIERLIDLTERHADAGLPPPETLRRLSHAVLTHQAGKLQDDATMLLLEWTSAGESSRWIRATE